MYHLDSQENEDVTIEIPENIEGPRDVEEWFTEKGVREANIHYIRTMDEGSELEIKEAKRFYNQVKGGYYESENGTSPQHKKLRESTMLIADNVQKLNGHLVLADNGDRRAGENIDLGDDRLNRMMNVLLVRMNTITSDLETRMNRSIRESETRMNRNIRESEARINATVDRGFRNIRISLDSLTSKENNTIARFENSFKGVGGDTQSPEAYFPILNNSGEDLSTAGLEELTSLNQVETMNSNEVTPYLRFYGLNIRGNISERRSRLLRYIGVNFETLRVAGVSI